MTIGAAASKKTELSGRTVQKFHRPAAPSVSGPVATMTRPSLGKDVTSSVRTVILGCCPYTLGHRRRKPDGRSSRPALHLPVPGRYPPQLMRSEPSRRISSFKSPAALSTRAAFNELEQISSAKSGGLMSGGVFERFHFNEFHRKTFSATCQAASHPAQAGANHGDRGAHSSSRIFSNPQSGVIQYSFGFLPFFISKVFPQRGIFLYWGSSPRQQSHSWDNFHTHRKYVLFSCALVPHGHHISGIQRPCIARIF